MAVLGLSFCARAFSSCGKRGPLFIAVRGPLTIMASLVVEHRLQTCRLSNCGSRAQLLRGMWDLPRPGLEPVSPALAGRFSTTAPPGKPKAFLLLIFIETVLGSENIALIQIDVALSLVGSVYVKRYRMQINLCHMVHPNQSNRIYWLAQDSPALLVVPVCRLV